MKLTQAILPVAGYGTRFLPWSKAVPKELLPIGNLPIIALLVDECMSIGIRDICFVISRGKEAIPQFFYAQPQLEHELRKRGKGHLLQDMAKYSEVNFHVVYQDHMLGDGHAILQAIDWVRSPAVAVLFGDDLIRGKRTGLEQMKKALETVDGSHDTAMLCLEDVPRKRVSSYGIVDIGASKSSGRLHRIQGLIEKPEPSRAPSTLAIVGKYIIPSSVLTELKTAEALHSDKELRLIDALASGMKRGTIDLYGYRFEGQRFDTGTPDGYRKAVRAMGSLTT